MWPALVKLLELTPHVTRLVPMADRYLQSRAENGKAQRRALEEMADRLRGDMGQMAEGMRGDLTKLAAAQASIYHQLNENSQTLARIAADARATRLTSDEIETRVLRMETRLSRLWVTVFAALIVFVIFAAGVIAVLMVLHMRQYLHGT